MNAIKRQTFKSNRCEFCDALRNEVNNLHKTLSKFTKEKDKHDMILSN